MAADAYGLSRYQQNQCRINTRISRDLWRAYGARALFCGEASKDGDHCRGLATPQLLGDLKKWERGKEDQPCKASSLQRYITNAFEASFHSLTLIRLPLNASRGFEMPECGSLSVAARLISGVHPPPVKGKTCVQRLVQSMPGWERGQGDGWTLISKRESSLPAFPPFCS